MRIVHIDFTGTYNEEAAYQENIIPAIHVKQGHEVCFLTTCYKWVNGVMNHLEPVEKILDNGVRLIRMEYRKLGFLTEYIRAVDGVRLFLEELDPDIIMLHCLQTAVVYDVVNYCRKHQNVVFIADSHTDLANSARSFASMVLLHKMLYRRFIECALERIDKMYFVSPECQLFFEQVYGAYVDTAEILPLGGLPVSDESYREARNSVRNALGIADNVILFAHSGKMNKEKRCIELVRSFASTSADNIRLLLVGSMLPEVQEEMRSCIEGDSRIDYLGWQDSLFLAKILCATDVYMQPGSQSATLQQAACCRCAVMVYPHRNYKWLFGDACEYSCTEKDIGSVIRKFAENPNDVKIQSTKIAEIGKLKLNYEEIAQRICAVKRMI